MTHTTAGLRFVLPLLLALGLCALPVQAQSTGKVAGTVTDARSGEPLIGVNVLVDGSTQGAATSIDGYYNIVGLRPGTYTLLFRYIGFTEVRVQNVKIDPGKTTTIDVEMQEQVIEGEEITVVAERPIVQVDRTTTTANVDSEQLQALPVTNIGEAINLQAGIVDGHFRGGRLSEVAYLVNGVPINNAFTKEAAFEVEQNMVENLEVISGVFNAEYGQALSGVVNITTKDVPQQWQASGQAYVGAIASERELEFVEREAEAGNGLTIDEFENKDVSYYDAAPFPNQVDLQLSLGGPILRDKLGFRASARYLQDEGFRLGRRVFAPSDSSQRLNAGNPEEYVLESTGDQAFVPLDGGERLSFNGSLVYRPTGRLRLDYNVFLQHGQGRQYLHFRKYVPEGTNEDINLSQTHILGLRYTLGTNTFVTASYSFLDDRFESRLFENLEAGDYVSPRLGSLAGTNAYQVGGNDLYTVDNLTQTHTLQADVTSQVTRTHLVKAGVQARLHRLDNRVFGIEVSERTNFEARVSTNPLDDNALAANPFEVSAYVQDKMEFQNLIVNAGLRFDLFEPDYEVPIDWTQGQAEVIPNLATPEPGDSLSNRTPAETKLQLSPRVGIAFPISATGVLRFSAGLFFQTPRFDLLYTNPEFEATVGGGDAFFGNPNLDPERTLTFELGLQQAITESLGLEVTVFSKDIRNLTGQEILRTPQGNLAVRWINTDVGTVRGITFSAFQQRVGLVSWTVDYTLQFAEGTASDPGETFARFQSGEEEIVNLVRLNWDRRHVLNNTITLAPSDAFELTFINRLESGTPYTTIRNDVRSLVKNDDTKPTYFISDLRLLYRPPFVPYDARLFLQVTNLFDELIQEQVYNDTGLATESLEKERFVRSGTIVGGVNTIDDFFNNPRYFGAPRRINVGLRFSF
jgi:outer membrane receptor protein involved in Fe transport